LIGVTLYCETASQKAKRLSRAIGGHQRLDLATRDPVAVQRLHCEANLQGIYRESKEAGHRYVILTRANPQGHPDAGMQLKAGWRCLTR
jgi:hypothetical protein